MSSLDNDSSVSTSPALRASCQARTVAISEVVMIESLGRSERRAVQPSIPDGSVAVYLEAGIGGAHAANGGQQQVLRRSPQRDITFAVVVGPPHAFLVVDDHPFARRAQFLIGRVQVD